MTHSHVRHDLFICGTWLIHTRHMPQSNRVWHRSKPGIRDMTYLYAWHDSVIYVTWPIHMWHDSLIRSKMSSRTCDTDVTYTYVWHDSFICVTRFLKIRMTWLIHMCVKGRCDKFSKTLRTCDRSTWLTWMTHVSRMKYDDFQILRPETWLTNTCDTTQLYV